MDTSVSSVEQPRISAVIVSWNARAYLQECLSSIATNVAEPIEVIVVDNASSDGSPEMVQENFPWVTLVQTGANLGFSKANNIGIARCKGKYIGLINSDVHVLPGCLEHLADFLEINPDVGMVGPRVLWGDRTLQSSCRRFPTIWNNVCEVLGLHRLFPKSSFLAGEHMFFFSYDRPAEVEVLVGCFILARQKAVTEFGGLDERFFMYGEDIDWSQRCRAAGWKVMFSPGAEAVHYAGGSSANNRTRFTVEQLKARLQLWKKHYPPAMVLSLRCLLVLQAVSRLLRAAVVRARDCKPPARGQSISASIECLRVIFKPVAKSR